MSVAAFHRISKSSRRQCKINFWHVGKHANLFRYTICSSSSDCLFLDKATGQGFLHVCGLEHSAYKSVLHHYLTTHHFPFKAGVKRGFQNSRFMPTPVPTENIVVTVAAGYREEQIRAFLASLQHFAPDTSLRLVVDRFNPQFQEAVRAWFPGCSFHLLPPAPLRDFALKRKWVRSILKRLARWSRSPKLGKQLLTINFLRHLVIRDLLSSWNLNRANILLCDSRDVVFQADPFSGEWPPLWTCEEDKRIDECALNASWLKRAGGEAALQRAKHQRVVCAGVIGGQADRMGRYFQQSSKIVEQLAPMVPLTVGDQGIHNSLVWLRAELGFTVLPNGCRLAANVGCTKPADLTIENNQVRLRNHAEVPAILHQYDRHPKLIALIQSKWANAKPGSSG